jgi:hypothetical protein
MYRNQTPVYLVKDDHGEILEGAFYAEELQKVIKTDDVYKIEPILITFGFAESHSISGRKCARFVGSLSSI